MTNVITQVQGEQQRLLFGKRKNQGESSMSQFQGKEVWRRLMTRTAAGLGVVQLPSRLLVRYFSRLGDLMLVQDASRLIHRRSISHRGLLKLRRCDESVMG